MNELSNLTKLNLYLKNNEINDGSILLNLEDRGEILVDIRVNEIGAIGDYLNEYDYE